MAVNLFTYYKKNIFSTALILLLAMVAVAQTTQKDILQSLSSIPNDTAKVRTLTTLSKNLMSRNLIESLAYANEAVKTAHAAGDSWWLANAYMQQAAILTEKANFSDADILIKTVDSIITKNKLYTLQPQLDLVSGRLLSKKHFRPQALASFLAAMRGFEKQGDSMMIAEVCYSTGALYFFSDEYLLSLRYLKRGQKIVEKMENQPLLERILASSAGDYALLKKYDTSQAMLYRAMDINQKLDNYAGLAVTHTNIGMNHYDLEQYDSALHHFRRAFSFDSLWQNPVGILYSKINMAAALRKLRRFDSALQLILAATAQVDTLDELYLKKTILEDAAALYEDLNNPQAALLYYKKYQTVKDSLFNEDKAKIVADLQTSYEVEKKDNQLLQAKNHERQQQMWVIGLIVLIAALTTAVILRSRWQKQQMNLAMERLKNQEQQLSSIAVNMLQKDELVEEITSELEALKNSDAAQRFEQLESLLNARVSTNDDWGHFQTQFEALYPGFFGKLQIQFPSLTATEIKMCAIEKLGIQADQAGTILGVNAASIRKSRYRMRKNLSNEQVEALHKFIHSV